MSAPEFEHSEIQLCPGGPMLVRGEHTVRSVDGGTVRTRGPLSAVCRCGKSGSKPWCDGTHKLLPEDKRP